MSKVIWIVNNSAGSIHHGMVYRNYYLALHLVELGYQVCIVSATYNHQFIALPDSVDNFNYETIHGIQYCWVQTSEYKGNGLGRVKAYYEFSRKVKRNLSNLILPKPDYVIGSAPMPMLGLLARRIAKKFKAKFIFEIRDLWPLTLIDIGSMSTWHPFVRLLAFAERKSLRKADAVVAVMPKADEYLTTRGMDIKKFHYIPNGAEPVENNKLNLPFDPAEYDHKFTIAYAGAHGMANNLMVFVEAIKQIPRDLVNFVFVGNGPQKAEIMETLQDSSNVYFYDSIPKEDVIGFLGTVDACFVGAMKKRIYQYGISFTKIFDYLFSGKPIVYAVEACNNIVAEAQAGISVPADSSSKIAEAIMELFRMDEKERRAMGERGRQHAISEYSWMLQAQRYQKVLEGLDEDANG